MMADTRWIHRAILPEMKKLTEGHFDEKNVHRQGGMLTAADVISEAYRAAIVPQEGIWTRPEFAAADAAYSAALNEDINDRMSALGSAVAIALTIRNLRDNSLEPKERVAHTFARERYGVEWEALDYDRRVAINEMVDKMFAD